MTVDEFVDKWSASARRERADSQSHFNDLCRLVGAPTPSEADPRGEWYCFERGATKLDGRDGWADVWRRGMFGWEYKGEGKDLDAAYRQLLDYREALENPPLLVVSDMDEIKVRTNFTSTKTDVHVITLDRLREDTAESLRILRGVLLEPDTLRPKQTPDEVTAAAASRFASVAQSLRERGHQPEVIAHFLNRVLFCLFAEDIGLLPRRIMTELIASRANDPVEFTRGLDDLFRRMSSKDADRFFGNLRIDWFNGGLFDGAPVIEFTREELRQVRDASRLNWSQVEPSILGTLFERGLDPAKRGQLGAHYTDAEKIEMVVEPVVMQPLRREFEAMRSQVEAHIAGRPLTPLTRDLRRRANLPTWERDAEATWRAFLERLRAVRVLDPACGSGNFLYVALRKLKDLELEAIRFGSERLGITGEFPQLGPHNMLGIELNPYAKELAGVSIWVGHIQWMDGHGYGFPHDPVLEPLDNIELRDAILARDAEGNPVPAEWPEAEFIIGNPPFLGDRMMRGGLGDEYTDELRTAYADRLPAASDLVCYWHELARDRIERRLAKRAGLLATNSIRGGRNRHTLERVRATGQIFLAWSDEPWVVEGAAVRVSIVGQDDGSESQITLDGDAVAEVFSDLTGGVKTTDLTVAQSLAENGGLAFQAIIKMGPFDIDGDLARQFIRGGGNPSGRSNGEVVVPFANALDIVRRPRDRFIVDFGIERSEQEAAEYEAPFEYLNQTVRPTRKKYGAETWWLHWRPRREMRGAIDPLKRFIATPAVSKHRLFVWLSRPTHPDHALIVVAREDEYAFGVLHSRAHELWSLRMGTWLGKGNDPRYTPTTTFETFPFPWPLNTPDEQLTPEQCAHRDAIAEAARALDEDRRRWLNPSEWVREEPDVLPSLPPRLVPVDEDAAKQLKQRTLTNLYNQRPTWLQHRHAALDAAVFASYGWPEDPATLAEEEILARLLALNLERAGAQEGEE